MSNLSELSVQLRKLQSEKNAQANEIDRLERQVRILSELKGISIPDLQNALRTACEDEAHGELRALVGKLRARVETLELGGGGAGSARRVLDEDAVNIPTPEQFDQEAAARARTTLELRVGELEEMEATLRSELDSLYENTRISMERNTLLETQVLQQKTQLEQWWRRWKAKEEEETRRSSIVPVPTPSSGSYNYSEFASPNANSPVLVDAPSSGSYKHSASGSYNYSDFASPDANAPPLEPILLHNAPQSEIDAEHEQRALAAEAALAGEKYQRALVLSQLSSAQKSYELKIDQHQHRVQFLEEQLRDLEQQLSSLYVAFGIMKNDSEEERNQKEAWKQTLLQSDAALAQEQTQREMNRQLVPKASITGEGTTPKVDRRRSSIGKLLSPSSSQAGAASSQPKAAVKPAAHPPIAKGMLFLLLDKGGDPLPPDQSPPVARSKSFSARKLPLKLGKSSRQLASSAAGLKFKRQYVVLHGANGLYQIRYGESYNGPVSGVCEFITTGVSSIEHTPRSSSQPFGFEVMINASNFDAPALCCAAETEEDFMMWMSALTSVMDGSMESASAAANTGGFTKTA